MAIRHIRGDTLYYEGAPYTIDGVVTSLVGLWVFFTVKRSASDADADAVFQSKKLQADTEHARNGIPVIELTAAEAETIPVGSYVYDIQVVEPVAPVEVRTTEISTMQVDQDITRDISIPASAGIPTVTAFALPATHTTNLNMPISTFTVENATHMMLTATSTAPDIADPGWTLVANFVFSETVAAEGSYTRYAWAKDAVQVSSPVMPQTCVVDLPSVVSWSAATASVDEGAQTTLTITRTGNTYGAITLSVAQVLGSAGAGDYTLSATTVTFASGDATSKSITLTTSADATTEGNETATFRLTATSGQATYGANRDIAVTINDTSTGAAPATTPYFQANFNAVSAATTGDLAPIYNFQLLDVVPDAGIAFTHEGVAGAGYNGQAVNRVGFIPGAVQAELHWEGGQNRNWANGGRMFLRGTFRLRPGWKFGHNADIQFNHKFMIIETDAVNTDRFVSQLYGRLGASNNPVLRQNSGALNTEATFGFIANLFDSYDYGSLAMRIDDGSAYFTPPVPLVAGETHHWQMEIQASSAPGATDGYFKLWINSNRADGSAGARFYAQALNLDYTLPVNQPVKYGCYLVQNMASDPLPDTQYIDHQRFELDTAFDPNWVPWDDSAYALYEGWNLAGGTVPGFIQWDSQTPNDVANVTMVNDADFIGGRALSIALVNGSDNNKYLDYTFGDHPLKAGAAVSEWYAAGSFKFETGYTWPSAQSQKILIFNLCHPTTGVRWYQFYLWVAPTGELRVARSWCNQTTGAWVGEDTYTTGLTIVAGTKYDFVLKGRPNTPGIANGHLRLHVNGVERINRTDINVRGTDTVNINKVVVTGHTSHMTGGNGYLRFGRLILSSRDPGTNA